MERRDFLRKSALAALGTAVGGTGLVQAFKHIDNGNKNTNRMKITVLTGSPRKSGNSACLAGQFIKGAEEKGHEVFRFDCAFKNVGPCRACNRCGMDGRGGERHGFSAPGLRIRQEPVARKPAGMRV